MEKEPSTDITVLYLLFIDFVFWDGKLHLFHLFLFILFCNLIVVNLFILKAKVLRCWGITIKFIDGKGTLHWCYCTVFIIYWFWVLGW